MPNYSYRSNDYMRRSQYGRQVASSPARAEIQNISYDNTRTNDCRMYDMSNNMSLAMAYIQWQEWQNLYSVEKAFGRGTIFEDLDKPFLGTGGCCK